MQQREQEDDKNALRQHQQRPVRHLGRNQPADSHNRAEMEGELDQTRPVRLAGQAAALLIGQRRDDVAMVSGFKLGRYGHGAKLLE
ncbi:hypothetical protein [Mesorhizobium sp. LSHC414A00]|uniref:hypothetical protein n=1 Tax=Mesorhizobium sp. LSHC414A00 TaxID=1287287 RepID=UPI001FD9C2D1|nr:hypothetical protein [Mesorhizobium sp. LSHC414A00]